MHPKQSYKIFSEIVGQNGTKLFVWYRIGDEAERLNGKHIVANEFLESREHWARMNSND